MTKTPFDGTPRKAKITKAQIRRKYAALCRVFGLTPDPTFINRILKKHKVL